MRGRMMFTLARVAIVLLLSLPVACFSLKQPPCAFTCVQPPHACPENYTCGSDGLCYREGADAGCPATAPEGGAASDQADDRDPDR